MFCVNPENGYLAVKQLAADGTCQFTKLYTAHDLAQQGFGLTQGDFLKMAAAIAAAYALTFAFKTILQQFGYRN